KGLPIGNLTSQHFANLYLGELDHFVKDRLSVKGYVRYMDDFLIFGRKKTELHGTPAGVRVFMRDALRLELKEKSTVLAPITQGISFLGFRVFPGTIKLASGKWARFRRQVRQREAQFTAGLIDEDQLARSVASMVGHVVHADILPARRSFFAD